ncbi:MAG: hypothetical protein HY821_12410 [Acidobacteria bacterium]|nr:hypothetical protein [Acidobacteriota bacterium]
MQRRHFTLTPLGFVAACGAPTTAEQGGWPKAWDRLLIEKAVQAESQRWDPDKGLLQSILGPEYRYHTKMRECRVHPTRDSLEYALNLLEEGSQPHAKRAFAILTKILALQVTDPASKWYGIWGWYMEEPPDKMAPADWNWADFNGSLLLLVELRHGQKLPAQLRGGVREAIRHAAESIRRRNVSMAYTNIAVKGTFVTLAAAELLGDAALAEYAADRSVRLGHQIDETGSFAEYNSPTYARVTLTNLTRIRMYVKSGDALRRAAKIEHRAWLHLATHWDAARAQFAGPMSRCYGNDAGFPMWLEKGLAGRLKLANIENRTGGDGETAIHDYRCPEELVERFLKPAGVRQHREWFVAKPETVGTTYFSKSYSLGSANRSDFWVQRRPLLGYFGDVARPARTVQLRVVKDGYDFSSALWFSVQQQARVLGLINFRNPGGDKHISLDMIQNGQFECGRLFAELDFDGLPEGFEHELKGGAVTLKCGALQARVQLLGAQFGALKPQLKAVADRSSLTVTLDFKPPEAARLVRWAEIVAAYAGFALELAEPGVPLTQTAASLRMEGGTARLQWGDLEMAACARVAPAAEHQAAFSATLAGKPAPAPRLSEEKLA